MKKVHFIAIGGSAMHSLAIALHKKGYSVSGSDIEIYDPSYTKLKESGLLPEKNGWFPEKITDDLDFVVLGMHASIANPELEEAQRKKIKIVSYSEFVYEQSKHKKRVVIGGSYGKTTITSMIIHVLGFYGKAYDYMIGSQVKGFDTLVKLSDNADICILEGDEYLSSVLDDTPKFLHFKPHIAILTGIAWEHANAFPTFEIYLDQFRKYIDSIEPNGVLIYNSCDETVKQIVDSAREDIRKVPYETHPYEVFETRNFLKINGGRIPINFFGEHNMQNISGAIAACQQLRFSEEKFYRAIISFKTAGKRLELLYGNDSVNIFLDKAQSQSRLTATLKAVREQYPGKEIISCLELENHGVLTQEYLKEYSGALDLSDIRIVYINKEKVKDENGNAISPDAIKYAFGSNTLKVFTDPMDVLSELYVHNWKNKNLLLFTNSNFSGIDFEKLAKKILDLSV